VVGGVVSRNLNILPGRYLCRGYPTFDGRFVFLWGELGRSTTTVLRDNTRGKRRPMVLWFKSLPAVYSRLNEKGKETGL
jgi:hypothetical protein